MMKKGKERKIVMKEKKQKQMRNMKRMSRNEGICQEINKMKEKCGRRV